MMLDRSEFLAIAFLGSVAVSLLGGCAEKSGQDADTAPIQPEPAETEIVEDPPPPPEAEFSRAAAQTLFVNNCAPCHGYGAAGDGPMAAMLPVSPRSLLDDEWRFIDPETPDDVEDLIFVVRRGLPESGMNGFENVLTEQEIEQIVRYVLDLRAEARE